MKKILLFAILMCAVFLLSGCFGKKEMAGKGASIADSALEISIWGVCDGSSTGAIRREFGNDPEKIEAWQNLCAKAGMPVSPVMVAE